MNFLFDEYNLAQFFSSNKNFITYYDTLDSILNLLLTLFKQFINECTYNKENKS